VKIGLKQFGEGRKVILTVSEDPKGLDIDVPGITVSSPIEINAEATRTKDTLDINVDMTSAITIECCRCLTQAQLSVAKNFRLDYPISKHETTIDITDDIRQELMLTYPLKPLCKADCKGLCIVCGKNLNKGPCDCKI
jgi:uncharacterized protein